MRKIDQFTLNGAAKHYASIYMADGSGRFSRPWVLRQLQNLHYRDEFNFLVEAMLNRLAGQTLSDLNSDLGALPPRMDEAFERVLRERLAIDPDGNHIKGAIGRSIIGGRYIKRHMIEVETPASIRLRKELRRAGRPLTPRITFMKDVPLYWPIYAGEAEERAAGNVGEGGADIFPEGFLGDAAGALNTRISNESAIAACDAVVDLMDEGTGAGVIQGRTGTQPADPDTTVTGTLLFTLVCSDPAFGNAVDDTGKATATASAITADSSADNTGTVGYCRGSATNDGATPLDDHIDGEAGTSGADFNFNTVAIVSGAEVNMDGGWTVSMSET